MFTASVIEAMMEAENACGFSAAFTRAHHWTLNSVHTLTLIV
jgi:hypothetical protein